MKLRQKQITRAELILDDIEILIESKQKLDKKDLEALKFMILNLREEIENEQKI
tara:strand:+ start:353 stop:514 length:162 start_codon:yes stop_codon:yes gene_type:complete